MEWKLVFSEARTATSQAPKKRVLPACLFGPPPIPIKKRQPLKLVSLGGGSGRGSRISVSEKDNVKSENDMTVSDISSDSDAQESANATIPTMLHSRNMPSETETDTVNGSGSSKPSGRKRKRMDTGTCAAQQMIMRSKPTSSLKPSRVVGAKVMSSASKTRPGSASVSHTGSTCSPGSSLFHPQKAATLPPQWNPHLETIRSALQSTTCICLASTRSNHLRRDQTTANMAMDGKAGNDESTSRFEKLQTFLVRWTRLPIEIVFRIVVLDHYYESSIGIMIHWGLYSVPAFDSVETAHRRRIQNGSEWYQSRLLSDKSTKPFPVSGWVETQAYHAEHYGHTFPYASFRHHWTASEWRVDHWMSTFRKAGASYVIITAKHHDGFCLWPSKHKTSYSVSDSAAGSIAANATKTSAVKTVGSTTAKTATVDVLGIIKDACKRYGIEFGIYYSWCEFATKPSNDYWETIVIPQIRELIAYRPDRFWFDGDWWCTTKIGRDSMGTCVSMIRHALPNVQINDRIGHKAIRQQSIHDLPPGATYRVYADREIPEHIPTVAWEHVNTIGLSWGFNYQQDPEHYKTAYQLLRLYDAVLEKHGRLLLNVGPDAHGRLDPYEECRLVEFGSNLPQ